MAAAAVRHGKIFATGAAGLRKAGGDEMVTLDDRWLDWMVSAVMQLSP